jgi:hypothetical protein
MPLPAMAGSDETLMGSPGMSQVNPQGDPGDQSVTPQDQAKGAVEILSKLRQTTTEQIEAIATQFPPVSKAAKDLQQAIAQGLQGLVREIIKTARLPQQPGPKVVR